ncbi:MAG: cytochrome c [Paracoccaceae bacterium]
MIIRCLAITAAMFAASGAGADVLAGRAFVEAHCADCHAIGRDDDSAHAAAPAFRDLGQKYPVEHLAEALAEGIFVGHEDMPEFALGSAEIDAVIGYLASIQTP